MGAAPEVLIVDDDPDILEALSDILESEGYAVRRARNGQEGLDAVAAQAPRVVLLDLMMPLMDGVELARRLGPKIPIIVLSADREAQGKAKTIQAYGCLDKPFE